MRFFFLMAVLSLAFTAVADPTEIMKKLDGYRTAMPPMAQPAAVSGAMIDDAYGRKYHIVHLSQLSRGLGAKSKEDCLALLSYLKDRDPKMRIMAAFALDGVLKASHDGLSFNDIMEPESEGHREMVLRFVKKISTLP